MRTALLSAVKRTPAGELRGELMLGGRSVLGWQVALARNLGCVRIVCLCDAPSPELLAQQRIVEGEGGEFYTVRSSIQLTSIIRSDDELFMFADGLLLDAAAVTAFCAPQGSLQKGIATLPSGHALAETHPEDFERIDRDRHWAGLAVMRANVVHKLADLPPDGEAMSLLLRLALQARTECHEIPLEFAERGHWMLAHDGNALAERERALIVDSAPATSWSGPGMVFATVLVRRTAPLWLEKGSEISALIAGLLIVSGIVLSAMGFAVAGLVMAALGAFSGTLSGAWRHMRAALWSHSVGGSLARWMGRAVDLGAVFALALALWGPAIALPVLAWPLIAIGLARLARQAGGEVMGAFWRDRALHLLTFALSAAFGRLPEALVLFSLGALLQLMLRSGDD